MPTHITGWDEFDNSGKFQRDQTAKAERIKALPWVVDGIDDTERAAVEVLITLASRHPDVFDILLQKSWLQDNVTQSETAAIENLRWMTQISPVLSGQMLKLSWVQDDITKGESASIEYLRWMAQISPALAERVLEKPWAQDNMTSDEATVIRHLFWMINFGSDEDQSLRPYVIREAIKILEMPFLDRVESADVSALMSLGRLRIEFVDDFLEFISHPMLIDGITDEEAKIVALLWGTHKFSSTPVSVLLDGTRLHLENRLSSCRWPAKY